MAGRSWKKRLAVIVAAGVLLLVAAWFAVRAAFPEEKLLAVLEPRLEAALGRPVSIESAVLRAFPLSIRLSGIRVDAEAAEPPLQIQTLACTLELWPLLGRRIVVESLLLEGPTLRLQQSADGTWSGIAKSKTSQARPTEDTAAPTTTPAALQVDRLQIRGGRLLVRSDQHDIAFDAPLEAELGVQVDRELRDVRVQGWIESAGIVPGGRLREVEPLTLRIEPGLAINVPDSTAQVERLAVTLQGLTLELEGTAGLSATKPHCALETRSQSIDLAALMSLVPRSLVPALSRFAAEGAAKIDLQIEKAPEGDPVILGSLQIDDGRFKDATLPESIENVRLRATLDRDALLLDELSANVAGAPVRVTGRVVQPLRPDSTTFALDVAATLDLARAAALGELPPGVRVAGKAQANVSVSGATRAPERALVRGPIDLSGVRIETPQLRVPLQMDAHLEGAGSGLRIATANVQAGASQLQVEGNVHGLMSPAARRVELRARSRELDLDALLPAADAGAKPASDTPAAADTAKALLPELPPIPVRADVEVATLRASAARIDGLKLGLDSNAKELRLDLHAAAFERDKLRLRNVSGALRGTPAHVSGPLRAESGQLDKLSVRSVQSIVRVAGTTVRLDSLSAQAYDGRVRGDVRVDLADAKRPKYEMRLDLDQVEVGALADAVVPAGRIVTGRVNGSSTWSGQAGEPAIVRSSLNASGQGIAIEGKLRQFPVLDAVSGLLQLPSLGNLAYKDLGFKFDVASGRVHVPEMRLASADADIAALGSIGLDGSLDVDLNLVLSEALSKRYAGGNNPLQRLFANPDGRVVVDFDVGGTLKAPRVKPNLEATAARGLRSLTPGDLGRLLGGLAQPAPAASDSQATPIDKTLNDAQKRLGDRLRTGLGGMLKQKPAAADTTRKP
jgi:hypothetical protein